MDALREAMRRWRSQGDDADLATREGTGELVSFLVSRFVVVLLVVMLAESVVVWLESVALLPLLRGALSAQQAAQMAEAQGTTSLLSLLRWLFALLLSLSRGSYLQMIGLARGSAALLLIVLMLGLLVVPPAVGGLAFSRAVVRRVHKLQERRERELAQIDQQRSQFLVDIAHDLRSPLMAISGMAHAVADGVVRDDAMRDDYLRSICEKADKMGGLVSSVFEYTRLGSDAYELECEHLDLPQLLLREAAAAYTEVEDAGMTLSVEVAEERCIIDADSTQLGRVVANLLVNAVRHNEAGTEVALMLVRRLGVAYVVVADTGARILQSADDLFQPFSRGDAARSAAGGSGLGLSICKRVADKHGYGFTLVQPYGRFTKAFVLACEVVE